MLKVPSLKRLYVTEIGENILLPTNSDILVREIYENKVNDSKMLYSISKNNLSCAIGELSTRFEFKK